MSKTSFELKLYKTELDELLIVSPLVTEISLVTFAAQLPSSLRVKFFSSQKDPEQDGDLYPLNVQLLRVTVVLVFSIMNTSPLLMAWPNPKARKPPFGLNMENLAMLPEIVAFTDSPTSDN